MEEKAKSKPEHLLMEAVGFDEDDLEANRAGYMSKGQRARLRAKRSSWINISLVAVGFGFLVAIVTITDDLQFRNSFTSRVGSFGLICVGIAGVVSYSWLNWRKFDADLLKGEFDTIEGPIQLDVTSQGNRGTKYSVIIEGSRFNVTKPIFLAFKNGDPYCIYYAPRSKTILSAEWLRE
jgi:hypothetical protein